MKKEPTTTSIHEITNDSLKLSYQGRKYEIQITTELQINENIINTQLQRSPSNYAFLCLVRDEAIHRREKLDKEKDIAYSNAWVNYKESGNISNDLAGHKATIHPKYISICERFEMANHKANVLISICKAYENRERILQTVSANLRKQQ